MDSREASWVWAERIRSASISALPSPDIGLGIVVREQAVQRVLEVGDDLQVGEGRPAAHELAGEGGVGEDLDVARLGAGAIEEDAQQQLHVGPVDEAELHVREHHEDSRVADGVELEELGDLEAEEVHLLAVEALGYLDEDDVVVDVRLDDAGSRVDLELDAEDLRERGEHPVDLDRLHDDALDVEGDELEQAVLVDLLRGEDDGDGGRVRVAVLLLEDFLAGAAREAVVDDHEVGEAVAELDRPVEAVDRRLHVEPAAVEPVLQVLPEQVGLVDYQDVLARHA